MTSRRLSPEVRGDPLRVGKGIAIEVQYRNETKYSEGTERDYLPAGYSILWLDESHFKENQCNIDTRYVRQNAVTCWPNAVPDHANWLEQTDPDPLTEVQTKTFDETASASQETVPATLHQAFFDEIARELFREQDWDSLFTGPTEYSDIWCYTKVPATLPSEWHAQQARDFWENKPWDARFPGATNLGPEYAPRHSLEVKIDFPSIVSSDDVGKETEFVNTLFAAWQAGQKEADLNVGVERPKNPFDDVQCKYCGTYWYIENQHISFPEHYWISHTTICRNLLEHLDR